MNTDGSGLTNVTAGLDYSANFPTWSADGTRIAFVRPRTHDLYYWIANPADSYIQIMDSDGSNLNGVPNLVVDGDSTDQIGQPSLSPDGTKLAFTSKADGYWHIYTIGVDGTNRTNVTGDWYTWCCHEHPEWSPDGNQIVFQGDGWDYPGGDGYHQGIWRINAGGTGGSIVVSGGHANSPDWSPNGDRIAFSMMIDGGGGVEKYHIHTVSPDGTDLTLLTRGQFPSWSPDGSQIVFARTRIGWPCCGAAYDIFVMDADGSNLTQITNYAPGAVDWFPDWSP